MKRYLLSFLAAFALVGAGAASAGTPGAADVAAIGNNLGPTVEALASGLGNTANVLISTQSAVQTSAALGNTLVSTGSALIAGAPNLGAAGLLPLVANAAIQQTLHPVLNAIDNPSTANIKAALALEQNGNAIVGNLDGVLYAAIEGSGTSSFTPYGNGLRAAGIELLQGQISGLSHGAVIDTIGGVEFPLQTLLAGTTLQPAYLLFAVGGIAVPLALDAQLQQLDGPATQLATAGAPLTAPVIGILKAGF